MVYIASFIDKLSIDFSESNPEVNVNMLNQSVENLNHKIT